MSYDTRALSRRIEATSDKGTKNELEQNLPFDSTLLIRYVRLTYSTGDRFKVGTGVKEQMIRIKEDKFRELSGSHNIMV